MPLNLSLSMRAEELSGYLTKLPVALIPDLDRLISSIGQDSGENLY
jgi:hypothetical protein